MATTVGGIIRAAMRKVLILDPGEPIPKDDEGDALEACQFMADAWTTETLLIPVVGVVTKTLQADSTSYTIGIYPGTPPDADVHIETARPEKIIGAFIRDSAGTDYPQKIIYVKQFNRISRKSEGSRPSQFYVRQGWPLDTIIFESLPYATETINLTVIQPLSEILAVASLTEVINLPPGYKQALVYNLALEYAPEWGKDPKNFVTKTAKDTKKWIKRKNYRSIILGMDRALTSHKKSAGTYKITQGP